MNRALQAIESYAFLDYSREADRQVRASWPARQARVVINRIHVQMFASDSSLVDVVLADLFVDDSVVGLVGVDILNDVIPGIPLNSIRDYVDKP